MKYSLFLCLLLLNSACKEKELPSEADMNDTLAIPITKEVDDASTYMSDTNRVTVEDSVVFADSAKRE